MSLAGHIEGCSAARRRVPRILRSALRSTLRPVLRGIFHAALRNQEIRGGEWGQEARVRAARRSCSADSITLVTVEWWTPVLSAMTAFLLSVSDISRILVITRTG